MKRPVIIEIISLLYIVLFVYAATVKLMDYHKFTVQLSQSVLLTDFAGFIGWFIPAAEIATAFLLMMPGMRLAGLYSSFTIMAMFSAYIVAITRFTENAPCSCGGVLEKMTWNQHLVFNIFYLLLAGIAIFLFYDKTVRKAARASVTGGISHEKRTDIQAGEQ